MSNILSSIPIFLSRPFISKFILTLNLPSYHSVSYTPYSYPTHPITSPLLHHAAAPYYHPTATSLPHYSIPAFGLQGLPYNGLPYSGLPAYAGAFHPYAGFPTIAYNTLASVPAEAEEE